MAQHTSGSCRAHRRWHCCPVPDSVPWQSRASESLKNQPFAAGEEPVLRRRCSGHGGCVSPSGLWLPSDAAWPCAAPEAALCLYGGFKMQIWTRALPTCLQKQPFEGRGLPQVCVLIPLGAGDPSVPQAGVFGDAQHKNLHPCCYVLSPKLSHLKARATKIADSALLEMLY